MCLPAVVLGWTADPRYSCSGPASSGRDIQEQSQKLWSYKHSESDQILLWSAAVYRWSLICNLIQGDGSFHSPVAVTSSRASEKSRRSEKDTKHSRYKCKHELNIRGSTSLNSVTLRSWSKVLMSPPAPVCSRQNRTEQNRTTQQWITAAVRLISRSEEKSPF